MFSRLCSLRQSLEHRVRAIVLHRPASVKRRHRGEFCGAFDGSQPRASQKAVTQKILQEEAPTLSRSPFRPGLSPDGPPSHWTHSAPWGPTNYFSIRYAYKYLKAVIIYPLSFCRQNTLGPSTKPFHILWSHAFHRDALGVILRTEESTQEHNG